MVWRQVGASFWQNIYIVDYVEFKHNKYATYLCRPVGARLHAG